MWLSREREEKAVEEAAAESGPVTLAGTETAVYLEGERRNVALCAPGGYAWRPQVGQEVLVLKAGRDKERPYILGVAEPEEDLDPGQVRLGSREAGVTCDGRTVALTGRVSINGESLESFIRRHSSAIG